jgi:uncharacterized protein YutE (UPF0331/DUF86 family)
MDIDLIRAKEDSIVRCVQRVRTKSGLTYDQILTDYDAQDVVVLNLERAVQQAVDVATHMLADSSQPIPETMRAAFTGLSEMGVLSDRTAKRMVKAVGFRNTAVHAYQQIDWAIVRSIITDRLSDFGEFIKEVDDYLANAGRV